MDVIRTVNQYAFDTSSYPVILSFENHCSIPQQVCGGWSAGVFSVAGVLSPSVLLCTLVLLLCHLRVLVAAMLCPLLVWIQAVADADAVCLLVCLLQLLDLVCCLCLLRSQWYQLLSLLVSVSVRVSWPHFWFAHGLSDQDGNVLSRDLWQAAV